MFETRIGKALAFTEHLAGCRPEGEQVPLHFLPAGRGLQPADPPEVDRRHTRGDLFDQRIRKPARPAKARVIVDVADVERMDYEGKLIDPGCLGCMQASIGLPIQVRGALGSSGCCSSVFQATS